MEKRKDSFLSQLIRKIEGRPLANIGKLIERTAGKRHAWFESNVGRVRKPYIPA